MSGVGIRVWRLASTSVTATGGSEEVVGGEVNAEKEQKEQKEQKESGDESEKWVDELAAPNELVVDKISGDLEPTNEEQSGSGGQDVPDSQETSNVRLSGVVQESTIKDQDKGIVSEDEDMIDTEASSDNDISDAETTSESEPDSESDSDSCSSSGGGQNNIDGVAVRPCRGHVSCIQEAQLSPDGRYIFTSDYERTFAIYPVVPNVVGETVIPQLKPWAKFGTADPIWAFSINPWFDADDVNTTTVLVSRRDQYISLHNALWGTSRHYEDEQPTGPVDISNKLASYKLIDHLTEAVLAPLSLAYSRDGNYFYAGHQNRINIFDLNHTNDPIVRIPTIPSANTNLKGGGRGFKGHITALSVSQSLTFHDAGIIAAGSRTRYVGLYDGVGGEEITHFALPGKSNGYTARDSPRNELSGDGVTSLKWSPDGTYLYIAERNSDSILIYDARKFSLALGHCAGRAALTNQKLGFDLYTATSTYGSASQEVWAGGTDGKIRVWMNPHLREGRIEADDVVEVGEGPVVGTLVHESGGLVVAASGTAEMKGDKKGGGKIRGSVKGGAFRPTFREWGCLDVLGLGSY